MLDYVKFNIERSWKELPREQTIVIYDSLDFEIKDSIKIIQGAISDSVILVSPQIQTINYLGGYTEHFEIFNHALRPLLMERHVGLSDFRDSLDSP